MRSAIFSFLTHEAGFPLTYGVVVDRRGEGSLAPDEGLEALAAIANAHPGSCAFGKIAVLAPDGIHTFQAGPDNATQPVFCGNSTAAALASLGRRDGVSCLVHGMASRPYAVGADIGNGHVTQLWTLPCGGFEEREWRSHRIIVSHALNDYALVAGGLPEGIDPETARRELLGDCIGGKLAVICPGQGAPLVEFHNANGRHGAVPHTGIATIALAARKVSWLRKMVEGAALTYRSRGEYRIAQLPKVIDDGRGDFKLEMPAIEVTLEPVCSELAA